MTGHSHLVLVVDDDGPFLGLMCRFLERLDYEVLQAATLEEAVEIAKEFAPEIAFVNGHLPDGEGIHLIRPLQEADPDVVVLMTSANRSLQFVLAAMREGASDFLSKPLEFDTLEEKLKEHLAKRKARIESRNYQKLLEEAVATRTMELGEALDKLSRVNDQMSASYAEALELLHRAAAYRDDDTGHHVSRIRLFTRELALAHGLGAEQAELIAQASAMHDIGKIGIPDQILLKPGKLTPDEWEVMKAHTTIGANIIGGKKTPLLDMCREIALTHHEKWNGGGYPAGLAGEAIPLAGRLVAIVDVFDALTHARVYKPAFSTEKAIQIIEESRGSHFDPRIVECFLPLIPRLKEMEASFDEEISAEVLSLHARRQKHAAGEGI
ncbi:MAG: response regulator [Sumerlaeia bacterium]